MTQRREKQPWRDKGEREYGEECGEGAAGEKLLVGDVDGRRDDERGARYEYIQRTTNEDAAREETFRIARDNKVYASSSTGS